MADNPEYVEDEPQLDTSPERDSTQVSQPAMLGNAERESEESIEDESGNGGEGDSASVMLETLVLDVANFVTSESSAASGSKLNENVEEEEVQHEGLVGLAGMLMGMGIGANKSSESETDPATEEDGEPAVNIRLDEMGNYLPPCPSLGGSASSLVEEDENAAATNQSANGNCRQEDGTSAEDNATSALILMNLLIEENKSLRSQNSKLKRLVAYVMSKYRNSVTFLLNELDLYKNDYQKMIDSLKEKAGAFDSKMEVFHMGEAMEQMKQVMWEASRADDLNANAYEEKISALQLQNQGLQKLIRIALDYGNHHFFSCDDKGTQTVTPISEQASKENVADKIGMATLEQPESNLDVFLASYQALDLDEDLDESFHTAGADSLHGSNNSLNKLGDEDVREEENYQKNAGGAASLIGDHDKVEFGAEDVNNVILPNK